MKIFGKKPTKKTAWFLAVVVLVFLVVIWQLIVISFFKEDKDKQEDSLFEIFREAYFNQKDEMNQNIENIKTEIENGQQEIEEVQKAEELEVYYENKLETESEDDNVELDQEDIEKIKQQIIEQQNKSESNEQKEAQQ